MVLRKINKKGEYTPFPGITIISKISEKDSTFWEDVYNALQSDTLITRYYAILPSSSYHMTTTNLYVQGRMKPEQWKRFIQEHQSRFVELYQRVNKESFLPEVTLVQCKQKGALQLIVSIPDEQKKKIEGVAEEFRVFNKIPPAFHITMAYQYAEIDAAVSEQVQKRIDDIFKSFFNKRSNFTLKAPRLCYFNDMTAFSDWDGEGFPFDCEPSPLSVTSSFFSLLGTEEPISNEDSCSSEDLDDRGCCVVQ